MIRYFVDFWTLIASPNYPTPPAEILGKVTSWVRRDSDPKANVRQFAAMAADGDRTEMLGNIGCPTLVIHGAHDPLIRLECGQHTADCIQNAALHVVDGMGHEIPEQLVPPIAERIAQHCGAVR